MGDWSDEFLDEWDGTDEDPSFARRDECETCKGSGLVTCMTPTRRQGQFIASYGTCPNCDGTGDAP